jgi:hypothetical protein
MADVAGTGIPGIALLPAELALAGVLLAPVIGAIASLLSRPSLQRRQQELDYRKSQLDMIEKALTVGKSVSNTLGVQIDVSAVETEYRRVLSSITAPEHVGVEPAAGMQATAFSAFVKRPLVLRLLWLPRPQSLVGWIVASFYYITLVYFFLIIIAAAVIGRVDWARFLEVLGLTLFVLFAVWKGAVALARSAARHAQAKLDDEARAASTR